MHRFIRSITSLALLPLIGCGTASKEEGAEAPTAAPSPGTEAPTEAVPPGELGTDQTPDLADPGQPPIEENVLTEAGGEADLVGEQEPPTPTAPADRVRLSPIPVIEPPEEIGRDQPETKPDADADASPEPSPED